VWVGVRRAWAHEQRPDVSALVALEKNSGSSYLLVHQRRERKTALMNRVLEPYKPFPNGPKAYLDLGEVLIIFNHQIMKIQRSTSFLFFEDNTCETTPNTYNLGL
jgi:hypothetical protein